MLHDSSQFDYSQLRTKLRNEEDKSSTLKEILNLISESSGKDVEFVKRIGVTNFFNCLKNKDSVQVELACQILKELFKSYPIGDVLKKFTTNIMYLLRHDSEPAKRLAVDEIYKIVTTNNGIMTVPEYVDVFVAVAHLLGDTDLGIVNKSIQITSNLPFEAYPRVLEEMTILLDGDNSCRCNVYEVIILISLKSFEILEMTEKHGYINFMVCELQSDDVLYHLNILELLSRLVTKPHGVSYLIKFGALDKISSFVIGMKNNPLKGLLTPGYLKFFGNIAYHFPNEMFEKYPVMLDLMFDVFETNDQTSLPVAIDTLGYIGSTTEGKLCLTAVGSKYIQTLERLGSIVRNSTTELKVRALLCFANIINIERNTKDNSGTTDNRITLMTREWFRNLGPYPMEVLCEICKNPFPEIKLAGLTLLNAVCQHQWGQEYLANTAGFIEYLLDRSTATTKEAKELQFEIMKKLTNSGAFDAVIATSIQKYVEQGPFYSENIMHVALEDNN